MEMKTFNKSNDADGKGDATKPGHTANEMEGTTSPVVAPTDTSASNPMTTFPHENNTIPPTSLISPARTGNAAAPQPGDSAAPAQPTEVTVSVP